MKKELVGFLAALGMLLGGTGCINHQYTPLPKRDLIKVAPLDMDNLPLQWISKFNKNVTLPPLVTSSESNFPFDLQIPKNSVLYGSAFNSIAFSNSSEVYSHFFKQKNQEGADLKFWRDLLYRMMSEVNGYKDIQERGFITLEAIDGFDLTGVKQVEKVAYKYRVVCVLFDDELYFGELYGHAAQVDQAANDFDDVVRNWNLSIWRIKRDRSETCTFFSYDPVVVNLPPKSCGFKAGWSDFQLGLAPCFQVFDSSARIYGLNLNLITSQQARTYGISLNLFSGSKDHRGLQIGALMSSAEDHYGLALSALYSAARRNNGILLSLFTRSEEGSNGIQLGLLNFSSSPRYLSWCPLISIPLFKDDAK